MNTEQQGFFSLSETLRKYDHPVTYREIFERASAEKWSAKLMRMGLNSAMRQINRHNEKFTEPKQGSAGAGR